MIAQPTTHIGTEGFSAFRISPSLSGWPLDPFLHIEFRKYGRVRLPPRPKAGRTCIHYVFEDSPSSLQIRNSLGESHVIEPGMGLISFTGRGFIESLTASNPDKGCETLMAAINLLPELELNPAKTTRIESVSNGVIWGDGTAYPSSTAASISFVRLSAGETREFSLPKGVNGTLVLREGKVDGWPEHGHCRLYDNSLHITAATKSEIWVFSGVPQQVPVDLYGPFSMSDRLRNRLAALQYRRGDWGHVDNV